MALSNLAAISSSLSLIFEQKLARQWNRMARTAALIKVKQVGGKSVNWDVSLNGQTAATYTEGADVGSGELLIDAKQPAILSWASYRNAFGFSEHQLEAAMSSVACAEELIDLMDEAVFESVNAIASKLNSDLFVGDGTSRSLVGLNSALLASGSYAGLDVGTYPLWASNINANGGTPRNLTVDLMSAVESAIFTASGRRPNAIVTTPALFNKYKSLFEAVRRIAGDSVSVYDTSVQDDSVYFMGVPVIRDKDCPAGTMYFLNTDSMYFAALPPQNFGDAFALKMMMGAGSAGGPDGEVNSLGLPIIVKSLAKTGDSVKFFAKSTSQLVIRNPNRCGILKDLQ